MGSRSPATVLEAMFCFIFKIREHMCSCFPRQVSARSQRASTPDLGRGRCAPELRGNSCDPHHSHRHVLTPRLRQEGLDVTAHRPISPAVPSGAEHAGLLGPCRTTPRHQGPPLAWAGDGHHPASVLACTVVQQAGMWPWAVEALPAGAPALVREVRSAGVTGHGRCVSSILSWGPGRLWHPAGPVRSRWARGMEASGQTHTCVTG